MRTLWNKFANFMTAWAVSIGTARAATELVRLGRHEEAKRLLLDK